MKFSLRWLQDYVELSVSPKELFERLTLTGAEVESVHSQGIDSPHVVVGEVKAFTQHPNADRLRLCRVFDGKEERQIVCGASNFKAGDKVPLALPGAELPGDFKIKESKIRGELSQGMMCSGKELGLGDDHSGILILDPTTSAGKKVSELFKGDTIFDVEVTPNRPDLLSHYGMAREIAAIGVGRLKDFPVPVISWPANPGVWSARLEAGENAPFFTATHMSVKVGPSPEWLREKIRAMGHKPINNVVDITNFVMWEMGQPLHAFDTAKLKGKVIGPRMARAGEKIVALDGKTYELTAEDFVIADESLPGAVAGIMGGAQTAIDENTTEMLLEAAWFEPGSVRRMSRRLGLTSDGCYFWERRVDAGNVLAARDRAIALLQELARAKVVAAPIVVGKAPAMEREITLRVARVEKLMGITVPSEKIAAWLTSLGLKPLSASHSEQKWKTPSFRNDLEREVDLIEEIARLHGMDNIPTRVSVGLNPSTKTDREHRRATLLRQTLATVGWHECVTDALLDRARAGQEATVGVSNPLNELYTHLRASLKPQLLRVAARNLDRGVKSVRIFESGRVYLKKSKGTVELNRLGLLVCGEAGEPSWTQAGRATDLYDLKGMTGYLEEQLGLDSKNLLECGPVSASERKLYGIKSPVYYAEYELDGWLGQSAKPRLYTALPQYPAMERDIAIVVDKNITHARVVEAIRAARIPQLDRVRLFDVFTDAKGEKIPKEKKSLGYALTYRADDRTLTEKEVNGWQEQLREHLKKTLDCAFRE
jgi:phenylalanyl-tRNA synthetase beta chain